MFPHGEPDSVVRWELKQVGDSDTLLLTATHSLLTKSTALRLAPGWHAYLDRLEAILNNQVPPDWSVRRGQRIISVMARSITTTTKIEGSN